MLCCVVLCSVVLCCVVLCCGVVLWMDGMFILIAISDPLGPKTLRC